MLDLNSPNWSTYTQAYGDASKVTALFAKLRAATPAQWDDAKAELTNAIMHQGDVYTATYAIAPHLLEYAAELGPGKQSDGLLFTIAYASRGGPGPDVPDALEDAWDDAQDEARDLILERLLRSETSEEYTSCLIAGLLYLSDEWAAASVVINWCWGHAMVARCPTCETETEVFWAKGAPRRVTLENTSEDVAIQPASIDAIRLNEDFEFDEDLMTQQIISLAVASGHAIAERQIRSLFGTLVCDKCRSQLPLSPSDDDPE
jgi:hypothetical protein